MRAAQGGDVMGMMNTVKREIGKALRPLRAGDEKVGVYRPEYGGREVIDVRSEAFSEGAPIPPRYAGDGENVSPPLTWGEVPAGTREVVVLCEDPDAPMQKPFSHWVMVGISPSVHRLDEGVTRGAHPGTNSAHKQGYMGPMPPPGHGVHHYHFEVFALDAPLSLGAKPTRDDVLEAMKGHVLACGETVGTYERN